MDKPFDRAERVWAEFLSVLATLPPPTRAVFLMHALFDADFEDIERTTGVRSEACGRHLEEARRVMSKQHRRTQMKIVVIGGTGRIGSKVVDRLRSAGHQVVAASPQTGVDILSGQGLDDAMSGTSVVVDLANSPTFVGEAPVEFFRTAGSNLLAAETRAGVSHHLALSIVGTERLAANDYFRAKLEQERLIRESGIPYTIIHSTQFYEFLPSIIESSAQDGVVRLPSAFVQPIAAVDVAEAVARFALQAPANGIVDIAGPERAPMPDLARRFMQAVEDKREVVGDPDALYYGGKIAPDTLVPTGDAWHGAQGFDAWFAQSDYAKAGQ